MTAKTTRWFLRKTIWGDEIFAVLRGKFDGKLIREERSWGLRPADPKIWKSTEAVSEWLFVGEDTVWECTEEEALSYLPAEAIETMDLPIAQESYAILVESNPYDNSEFPNYMHRLTDVLAFYLERKISPWTMQTYIPVEGGPYLQALVLKDGSTLCELSGNQFLKKPLDEHSLSRLTDFGWNLNDGNEHINHWFVCNITADNAQEVATRMAKTLYMIFKIGLMDDFVITPHPLNAGVTMDEFLNKF